MPGKVERKLTTILCADVQGYSRLMGADEVATLARLKQHRGAMVGLIERHAGRVVNTWGDGLIADFASVVEAVQCAIETQAELGARNATLADGERLDFRIGINLGDVMVEGGDLYGEGVNVAARLQDLAEPGGIVISGAVHDHVRGKLAVGFDDAGPHRVKNIAEPVRAFRVRLGPADKPERRPRHEPGSSRWSPLQRQTLTYVAVVLFLALLNVATGLNSIWFHWPTLVYSLVMAIRWIRQL